MDRSPEEETQRSPMWQENLQRRRKECKDALLTAHTIIMYENPDWVAYVTCVATDCDNYAQDLPASTWSSDFNIPVENWETPDGKVEDEIFTFHEEAEREWWPVVQEGEPVPHATYPEHFFGYDGRFTCNKCGSDATMEIEDHNLDGTGNNTELLDRLATLEQLIEDMGYNDPDWETWIHYNIVLD